MPDPRPLLTRRSFLLATAAGGAAAALAACSAAPTPSPSPGPTATPAPSVASPPTASPPPSGPPTPAPSPTPAGLSVREKAARMLVVGFRGFAVDDAPWVVELIRDHGLGGVILFDRDQLTGRDRNVDSPAQVRRLCSDLRALAADREVIVAIDQEGGVVTRLSPRHGFPAVASEASIGEQGDAAVRDWAAALATTLRDAGVNLNLAPEVDLDVNPTNPAVGALDRAFSADPAIVARDAAIEIEEHRRRGIRTALKHFPGLGSATVNTDFGVADVTKTWSDRELEPYRSLLAQDAIDLVMAAHVVNGQVDRNAPASLSRATVTGLLRENLGFDGPVITDDLQAAAITQAFGADDAVRLAIEAGCDLLLLANQQVYDRHRAEAVIDLVERLVADGTIPESRLDESVARLERLFVQDG